MADPFTIHIFVPEGDPEGVRLIDRMNWTGRVGSRVPASMPACSRVIPTAAVVVGDAKVWIAGPRPMATVVAVLPVAGSSRGSGSLEGGLQDRRWSRRLW